MWQPAPLLKASYDIELRQLNDLLFSDIRNVYNCTCAPIHSKLQQLQNFLLDFNGLRPRYVIGDRWSESAYMLDTSVVVIEIIELLRLHVRT